VGCLPSVEDNGELDEIGEPVADEIVEETIEANAERGDLEQTAFIDFDEWWKAEWHGMPEFIQEDLNPWKTLYVHFKTREDMHSFARLVGQRLTFETISIWFPPDAIATIYDRRYVNAP